MKPGPEPMVEPGPQPSVEPGSEPIVEPGSGPVANAGRGSYDGARDAAPPPAGEPWQLRMFRRTLKKQQKLRLLLDMLGELGGEACLLLTSGDNNGALNWHFREAGGRWTWAEMEEDAIPAMREFLGDPVHQATAGRLPFPDAAFERVVVIDAHEHLQEVERLNREISRVLAPGGLAAITTPNGNPRLPVARLKRLVGMHPSAYGHVVQGYTADDLSAMLAGRGLGEVGRGAYSRFFTELAELAINFAFVKVLSRRKGGERKEGRIAPGTAAEMKAASSSVRLYSLLYPLLRAFSALDALIPGDGGYAVAVAARKPR